MQSQLINSNIELSTVLLKELLACSKGQYARRQELEVQVHNLYLPKGIKNNIVKKINNHFSNYLPTVIAE